MPKSTCPQCIAEQDLDARPIEVRGLCRRHYLRGRRSGEVGALYAQRGKRATCEVDGCDAPMKARGRCQNHYMRLRRGADPDGDVRPRWAAACRFEGCERATDRDGYCAGHYSQLRRRKPLAPLREYIKRNGETCAVLTCDRPARNQGLCTSHYNRRVAGRDDWDAPIRRKAKDGDGWVTKDGYHMLRHGGRSRMKHHVIAEHLLGRPLLRHENVHHKNGDRADNRADGPFRLTAEGKMLSGNLELWSSSQPAGQEIGPKVEWAVDLLRLYAPERLAGAST